MTSVASAALLGVGAAFLLTGTIALLRFPDVFTRLHALTKADNLGVGLIVAGLILRAESPATVGKLVAVWLLVLLASATGAYAIAARALREGRQWPQ